MALKIPLDFEIYRRPHWADPTDMGDRFNGCFIIPARRPVIAFPGGAGTADMVAKARLKNVRVIEVPPALSPTL